MILEHQSYGSVVDALPTTPKHDHQHDKKVNDDVIPSTPTRTAPCTPAAKASSWSCKRTFSPATPFFIMDWLKDVNPEDLEVARKILQTPNRDCKNHGGGGGTEKEKQALKKDLFPSSSCTTSRSSSTSAIVGAAAAPSPSSKLTIRSSQSTTCIPLSPVDTSHTTTADNKPPRYSGFHKRSITIGNGWNAKGLQKAKAGQWCDALACWENALEIRRQVLGDHHVDVANTFNNMGIALGRLHETERAITCLHAALEIRTLHFGGRQQEVAAPQMEAGLQNHAHDNDDSQTGAQEINVKGQQEVAATLHNLANVHQQSGDLQTALEYFCESMQLLEKIFGKNHAHVARAHVAIAHLQYEANELFRARRAYQTGLNIMERCCDDEHGVVENEIASVRADLHEVEALLLEQPEQQQLQLEDGEKETTKKSLNIVVSLGEHEEKKEDTEEE